ncbi:Por secretion system C-terminal sorting domain-containing protein [Chryseobacterium sp. RU37D]|uniref:endonuclease n=1 Tax=Chryseobacterium sp. RU37D TaxID=1907397 RepID=UPI0009556FA1|nr:endonuclease [Chryseobacterium sp. RU37D]SIQ40112.1 Por secretion system C-terminal sorting domain-containing protein [Chryseobacterium sp. RU37D]
MKHTLLSFFLIFTFISAFAQIPTGYYDGTATLSGAALKTKLKEIITNGHVDHGYNGLWSGYQTTDIDKFYENDNSVLDIYSENPNGIDPYNYTPGSNQCGSYNSEGDCYNREHIVPQSLFNEQPPMVSDIHFIRPTDGKVNGIRSNYPYGKVGTASFTSQNGSKLGNSVSPGYSGTVFEPIDSFKGDVARMIFYFVTRYETQLSGFTTGNMLGGSAFPGLQNWELNQLLAWNTLDPVSPAEIERNNKSYAFQGNRNPYIDHPEFANQIWGTPTADSQAPTAPTNLVTSNPSSNSIFLNWTASTDDVGVAGYDIYKDGVFYATVLGTTATVSGLNPSTTYNFYIIAKDAAGNFSTASNTAPGTTLAGGQSSGTCGTETFETIPNGGNGYGLRTWTNGGITWNATDARTDQTINNKAITLRSGNLTSSSASAGIQSLTLTTSLKFGSGAGVLNVEINGVQIGTVPYSSTTNEIITTTINNINVTGNVIIKIINPTTGTNGPRVAIDDLSWTCYSGALSTAETAKEKSFSIYPNPVRNNELFVKGENLSKISKAQIYDLSGTLIETIENPFKKSNKINLKGLTKGSYILKTDTFSTKFIVE